MNGDRCTRFGDERDHTLVDILRLKGLTDWTSNAQNVDEKLTDSTEGAAMTTEATEERRCESTDTDDRTANRTEANRGIECLVFKSGTHLKE